MVRQSSEFIRVNLWLKIHKNLSFLSDNFNHQFRSFAFFRLNVERAAEHRERTIAQLGSWNGRKVSPEETKKLINCACPACVANGIEGLKEQSTVGFRNRATHNLWVLLEEEKWISTGLRSGEYKNLYLAHLDNTIYRPIIKYLVENFISD